MITPQFDYNELTLIKIALKETGQKYNNFLEPMTNLRVRISREINKLEKTGEV
tara:strand:- start:3275 stop:3433 length:159 start_codon:yes stop_codon:yes gene_type:complete